MVATVESGARVIEPDRKVTDLLDVLRQHLGMDVAVLAIWQDRKLVVQLFAGDGRSFGLVPGITIRNGGELYRDVREKRIPLVSGNAHGSARAGHSSVLDELDVGAYAMTTLTDGRDEPYGLLFCLTHDACPTLQERHQQFVQLIAAFLRDSLLDLREMWQTRSQIWSAISDVIDGGGPDLVFQPIVRIDTGDVGAVEALARFSARSGGRIRTTEEWFRDARLVGLSTELDLAAIRRAVAAIPDLPPGLKLAVNASPSTVVTVLPEFVTGLAHRDRLIIEITEQENYTAGPETVLAVSHLRDLGVRIAIDDAGTGYSGLEKLVLLRPDVIKIDQVLTRGIDRDPARRALTAGLVALAGEIGGTVIAEGIETRTERDAMVKSGVRYGQGYYLGMPSASPAPRPPAWVGAGPS
ncbi:EAL domain-containing protein [Frankia sp. AgB1.9]|uniref:EAL domain-containing protein n=1 Tax=unclassified Frankia TaxID=2632575 RepID=UPI001932BF1B|nr:MULTISPECIES: EAL domain-containing protein [unclassified Frankia]MBL7492045.1 EAL domain-containing protein [Frankia sp. AgW1.1]MBL7551173.1 EAL domain-containing protein [Frankia sp. AgB1.9]MBL7617811.1 EAL domain-containing protein [Frankia sp. AgB1.8]